ncbi:hypothetical protein LN650_26250 [Klebsiella pneumoniae subsp. pneumoniae]|nr:hypothetical protein [Klebsiella pneumoniae subsp. pneumoniae]
MKFLLSISLLSFFLSPGFRRHSGKIVLLFTQNVTISRFHYQLSTMKWGDHFQVASGMRQAQTKNQYSLSGNQLSQRRRSGLFPGQSGVLFLLLGNGDAGPLRGGGTLRVSGHRLPYYKKPAA